MRITRKQVDLIQAALQDLAVDEIDLAEDSGGKLRVSAVEVVERLRPIPLGKVAAHTHTRPLERV